MTPEDQDVQQINALMDSLDWLMEERDFSGNSKEMTFTILIASYFREVSEDILRKLIDYVELDVDDEEFRGFINACHFNNVLRVINVWEEDSIIDPSNAGAIKGMMSPEHMESMEKVRSAIASNRSLMGV